MQLSDLRRPGRRHRRRRSTSTPTCRSARTKEAGGFKLTGITLTVRGEVDGLDEAGFKKAAEKAKADCPVSKALTAVDITLDAALEG